MTERHIVYFGYGSLVNRDTRPSGEDAARARLHGWRRLWGHRADAGPAHGPRCSLSVEPDGTGGSIDGVIVRLPLEALALLDAREGGYDRLALPARLFELPEGLGVDTVHVYRSRSENRLPATAAQPILQSYIDCVMAGYLRLFGERGLDDFVATTRGWTGAIENDRATPRYSRAVRLPESLHARFDRLIARARGDGAERLSA